MEYDRRYHKKILGIPVNISDYTCALHPETVKYINLEAQNNLTYYINPHSTVIL